MDLFNGLLGPTQITALHVTSLDNATVAHMGTSDGRILQVEPSPQPCARSSTPSPCCSQPSVPGGAGPLSQLLAVCLQLLPERQSAARAAGCRSPWEPPALRLWGQGKVGRGGAGPGAREALTPRSHQAALQGDQGWMGPASQPPSITRATSLPRQGLPGPGRRPRLPPLPHLRALSAGTAFHGLRLVWEHVWPAEGVSCLLATGPLPP